MPSMDLIMTLAARIKCFYLNIRAIQGMEYDNPENNQKVLDVIKKSAKNFRYVEVEGKHHVHLNEPEKIAAVINEYLESIN